MDKDRLVAIIKRRLGLSDQEFRLIEEQPRFQKLFDNALEASKYRLVAEVVESKGCRGCPGMAGEFLQLVSGDSPGTIRSSYDPDYSAGSIWIT